MITVDKIDLEDTVLTPAEAGKIFNVSASAMYKKAQRNQVPSHKMGRKLYFLKSEMIAAIRNS